MSRSEVEYLRHILDEAAYLARLGRATQKENFMRDDTLKRASTRSIEIIGEATKQLSDELRKRHSAVPWRSMARMRDRLIHGYFSVDYDIVWDVAKSEAPALQRAIEQIIEAEEAWADLLMLGAKYPLEDGLDGRPMGTVHDNLWSVRVGVR